MYVCDADENHPDCVLLKICQQPYKCVSTSIGVESRRGEEKVVLCSPGVRCKRRVEYEKYIATFGWWRCSVYWKARFCRFI